MNWSGQWWRVISLKSSSSAAFCFNRNLSIKWGCAYKGLFWGNTFKVYLKYKMTNQSYYWHLRLTPGSVNFFFFCQNISIWFICFIYLVPCALVNTSIDLCTKWLIDQNLLILTLADLWPALIALLLSFCRFFYSREFPLKQGESAYKMVCSSLLRRSEACLFCLHGYAQSQPNPPIGMH